MWGKDLTPGGVDVISGIGKTHQISEWGKKTGEKALWNPYQFSGEPIYHRLSKSLSSKLIEALAKTRGKHFFIYIVLGMSGMYLLLVSWHIPIFGLVFGSLAFSFIPRYHVLFQVGHFQHFRTLMLMPFVIFGFEYLWNKTDLTRLFIFFLALSQLIGAMHYQIIYYVFLLLGFLIVFYSFDRLIKDVKKI